MYMSVSDFKFILHASGNCVTFVYLVFFLKTTCKALLQNRCKGFFDYDTYLLNEITRSRSHGLEYGETVQCNVM